MDPKLPGKITTASDALLAWCSSAVAGSGALKKSSQNLRRSLASPKSTLNPSSSRRCFVRYRSCGRGRQHQPPRLIQPVQQPACPVPAQVRKQKRRNRVVEVMVSTSPSSRRALMPTSLTPIRKTVVASIQRITWRCIILLPRTGRASDRSQEPD